MSLQRRPFDQKANPFLRTTNPFRVGEKFYTQSSPQEKYQKSYFTNHFYDNQCSHCIKNTSLLQDLNARSMILKSEKQNLMKKSSTMFKSGKLPQNPFEKSRLLGQNINTTNYTYTAYTHKDETKLKNLLERNPFKKYVQQRQAPIQGKDMNIEFEKINLVNMKERGSIEYEKTDDHIKLVDLNLNHEKKSSARYSIDSMNNFSNGLKSNQNSPQKKSKFYPTFGEIMSYRATSSRRSSNEKPPTQTKLPCLMKQISKSRKDLIQHRKHDSQRQIEVHAQPFVKSQNKVFLNVPEEQFHTKKQSKQDPQIITIKGKKFFRHPIVKRFY